MPRVDVNGIQMYYEIHGSGEPLVVILGLATDLSEWNSIIRPLAQRYRVLAFDNRGAGRTDKPDKPYSIDMMADDTAGLMDAVDIGRANVLGISMGGRIALALALRYPEKVSNLVLVSTSARVAGRRRRIRLLGIASGLPIFRGKYPQPRYAFLHQLEASSAFNCTGRLGGIHMPTLIMHGRRDKTAPYALAEEMHSGIHDSKMLAFDGGHIFMLMRERQRFLDAVTDFLGG